MASAAIPFKLALFKPEDFADYRSLTSNANIMSMITGHALDETEAQTHFESLLAQNQVKEGFGNFKLLNAETGVFMGLAKLVIQDKEDREAEIGFMLLEQFQGKGIATAATGELIEFARTQPTLVRLRAVLDPYNKASRKILIHYGFVSAFLGEIDGLPGEVMNLVL